MKDFRRGIIILLLGLLACITALLYQDQHWEMAFINFDSQSSRDILNIQARLLTGADPTVFALPTAAGSVKKKINVRCATGKIVRDKPVDFFHGAKYVSTKSTTGSYVQLRNKQTYLFKSLFETQSASLIDSLPMVIEQKLTLAAQAANCAQVDLYIASIKNISCC